MPNRILLSISKIATLLVFLAVSSLALADIDLNTPLPVDPDLKLAKLKNGLTYYIKKNNTPKGKVELRLMVKFGSVDESDDQLGAAHFIEHLAFKNSRNFKNNSLRSKLASMGVEFGRDLNAHTEFDLTRYEISLPSNQKSHLQMGLQALADFSAHVEIRPEDVTGEKDIIAEEQRLRNNLEYRKTMVLLEVALPETRYPNRSPIGVSAVRQQFTAPMLQQLYRQFYRPDQMAVMVVGDVDVALVEKSIEQLFSSITIPSGKPARYEALQTEYTDSRLKILGDEQQNMHELVLIYASRNDKEPQTKAELRLAMLQGRYVDLLRNRLSYFNQAYRHAIVIGDDFLPNRSLVGISIGFPKGGTEIAIKGVFEKLRQVHKFGFTESELEDVKKRKLSAFEQTFQERDKIESTYFIDVYRRHFFCNENLRSTSQHLALMQELYPTITLEDINQFAQTQFASNSALQFLYLSPKNDELNLPSLTELNGYVQKANQQEVLKEEPRKGISSLLKTPPLTAGKIVSETYNSLYGTTELVLSNGIAVILKKTDFTNQKIVMYHQRYGGTSLFNGDHLSAIYASHLTDRMGFDSLSPRDVQEFLQPKSVSLNLQLSHYSSTISGSTSVNDLETLLQWNYQRVTNPSRNKVLFSMGLGSIKKSALQLAAMDDWVIQDQFYKLVFNHDPRIQILPSLSELETLNIDRVLASFDRAHDNFDGSVFAFVGNVDVNIMRPLLTKYLANFPIKKQTTQVELQYPIPQKGVIKKGLFIGQENKAKIVVEFHGGFVNTDEERLRFKLLEDLLKLRITQTLRDEKHLIYTSDLSSDTQSIAGGQYRLILTLPCAPEQTEAVLSELFREIENLQRVSPTSKELDKVKKAWLQAHKDSLRNDWYWARKLVELKMNQQASQFLLAPEKLLTQVTPESLRRAALHYFDQKNYVQMVVKPQLSTIELAPEIQKYRNFMPRDFGLSELELLYRRSLNMSVAVTNAIQKHKTEYEYTDRSSDLFEINQLKDRLDHLTVSGCLSDAKRAQVEAFKLLAERVETVNIKGTTNVFGDKLSSTRRDKYFELLGEQNKLTTTVRQGMDKCEDGAPEK